MERASPQAAFDREFRRHIERFTQTLVAALRTLVSAPVPLVVKVLVFEMHADWRDFPVYTFAMGDEAPNQVYFEPPFNGYVLPDAGVLVPDGAIDQDGYEEAGVATYESGARVLAEWFGQCWHAAGGVKFPILACIHLHDDSDYFELRSRRWVKESDIWP